MAKSQLLKAQFCTQNIFVFSHILEDTFFRSDREGEAFWEQLLTFGKAQDGVVGAVFESGLRRDGPYNVTLLILDKWLPEKALRALERFCQRKEKEITKNRFAFRHSLHVQSAKPFAAVFTVTGIYTEAPTM